MSKYLSVGMLLVALTRMKRSKEYKQKAKSIFGASQKVLLWAMLICLDDDGDDDYYYYYDQVRKKQKEKRTIAIVFARDINVHGNSANVEAN